MAARLNRFVAAALVALAAAAPLGALAQGVPSYAEASPPYADGEENIHGRGWWHGSELQAGYHYVGGARVYPNIHVHPIYTSHGGTFHGRDVAAPVAHGGYYPPRGTVARGGGPGPVGRGGGGVRQGGGHARGHG